MEVESGRERERETDRGREGEIGKVKDRGREGEIRKERQR